MVPAGPRLVQRARDARREHRRRVRRRAGLLAAVALPVVVLAWLLLSSPLLRVERVEVTGASRLAPQQVELAAGVVRGVPLARVDTDAVRARLQALPAVRRVEVDRRWPGTLLLHVHERVPVAVAADPAGRWRLVDESGTPFEVVPDPGGQVRLSVPAEGPTAGDPVTRAALDVLRALPEPLRAQVGEVQASPTRFVTLLLRDGRSVVWGAPEQDARKARVVQALLQRPGRTLDVTAPGVAVVH